MLRKRLLIAFSLLIIASMVLASCQTKEVEKIVTQVVTQVVEKPGEVVVQTVEKPGENVIVTQHVKETVIKEVEKIVTQIVEVTATPPPVSRKGAWVDKVIFTSIDSAEAAVKQLQAGDIDIYAYTISVPSIFEEVKADTGLSYSQSVGSYTELTFNPAVFTDGRLNPFSNPKIREAMNWLIDRNYVVQEIYGGMANPRFTALNTAFPDTAKYVDVISEIETTYAYNPDKAKEVITAELTGMGAVLNANGKWSFNDAELSIIILIRTEDNRRQIGDYTANQLETVGFTVDRQYKTRSEASPIWVQGNPTDGLFHIYTGGWVTTAISRDDGSNFSFFYTPRDYPIPLWQAYTPTAEFDAVALKLRNNDFASMDERAELFGQALRLSLQDSVRIWLIDQLSFAPQKANLTVAYDLAGGVAGGSLWPFTIRIKDQEGGTVRVAQPGIMVDPWNPVGGSNWIYDSMPIRGTNDAGYLIDPYTGLYWPQRIEKADITVEEGLPVAKTLDWLTLTTAPVGSIEVPADAWVDWDAVNQKFITAGEFYTTTATAKSKRVVTYPADLWTTVKWHDGSLITMGDFIMAMIMTWDTGKPDSLLFDAAQEETLAAFMAHFKGVKIVSTDPLVIETYDDTYYLDAEYMVSTWWPAYAYGPGAWHNIGIGVRSEMTGTLAFSSAKADEKGIEWMSYIAGPSLDILKKELEAATALNYIPYEPTLGQYVTADEAALRYKNLNKFYKEQGHFWLGTGPFYLDKAFPIEQTLTLARFSDYVDTADKWSRFGAPKIAVAEVDGPNQLKIGDEATYDVYVTFEDAPYANAELDTVKFLLFDAKGVIVAKGDATAVEDGHFTVTLAKDVTSKLEAGSNKLVIAISSKVVSIPTFATYEFVTTAP
jgi:peptide/nickel transport system substrate-binding protein